MSALVLGGTGFIGMNVVRALVASGVDVAASRRARANTLFARKLGAKLVVADLDDRASLEAAMRGRDVVYNCAAHYPRYSLDPDREVALATERARNGVKAAIAAGVRRYVLTSSVATIGRPPRSRALADERDVCDPREPLGTYHAVKLAFEEETLRAAGDALDVVVLCPTGVMGELDVKAGTGFLVVAMGRGQLPFHVNGKTNVIDADDLALAHIAAAARGRRGERYIVAGHNVTVRGLLDQIADTLEVPLRSWPLPLSVASFASTFAELRCAALRDGSRPFLSRELVDVVRLGQWVDASKATRELGLPAPTPLAVTLKKSCDWYRRHKYVPPLRAPVHSPA